MRTLILGDRGVYVLVDGARRDGGKSCKHEHLKAARSAGFRI